MGRILARQRLSEIPFGDDPPKALSGGYLLLDDLAHVGR
jgi:hypothetical protein